MVLPTTTLPRARIPTDQSEPPERLDAYGQEAYGRSEMLGNMVRSTSSFNLPYEPPAWSQAFGFAPQPATLAQPEAAPAYRAQGFPIRIQAPNLFDIGKPSGVESALQGDLGVALGMVPGAQRGGFVNGIATAPITLANFTTWGREGLLALLTQATLGDTYMQQPDAQFGVRPRPTGPPAGPVEALLEGGIEGINAVGDAVWGITDGATTFYRDGEAQYRATQVARIFQSGNASRPVLPWEHGFIDNVTTSIFGGQTGEKYTLEGLRDAAMRQGVDLIDMAATYYDLPPEKVAAIAENPWMSDEQRDELVRDTPFSQDPLTNFGLEAAVQIALLAGGGATAMKGIAALTRLEKGPAALQALGNALRGEQAAGEATLGARAGHAVGFITRKGLQLNAWNRTAGWTVRGFEWGIKQVAGMTGNQGVVDTMDRMMQEMPLSMNPGLNLIDGFTTHPIQRFDQLRGRGGTARRLVIGDEGGISHAGTFNLDRRTFERPQGGLDVDALAAAAAASTDEVIVNVAGAEQVLPANHPIARMRNIVGALELDDMHARLFRRVGWTRDQVEMVFGEGNKYNLTKHDAQNALIYVYTNMVRENGGGPRMLVGATEREKSLEFAREAAPEAVDMLISDLKGESGHLMQEIKGQWWELSERNDSNIAEVKARLAQNYDPFVAIDNFARWLSVSKIVTEAYHAGQVAGDVVPTYSRRINLDYLQGTREHISRAYATGARVSRRDIETFRSKVGLVEELEPNLRQGRRNWTREQFLAMLDRVENLVVDARATGPRADPLLPRDWEPGMYFASDARVLGITPEDMQVIRAGPTGTLPPTNALREAARVLGRNPEELRRDPAAAWESVMEWMDGVLEEANAANKIRRPLEGFAEALRSRASEGRMDSDLATFSAGAIDRIAIEVMNEPRARPPVGAVRRPGEQGVEYADAAGLARWRQAKEAAGALAPRVESHLDAPAGRLRVVERLAGEETLSHAVLRGHEAELGWAMDLLEYVRTNPNDVLFSGVDAALIADPAIHPLLKLGALRRGEWRGAARVMRERIESLEADGDVLARQTAAEVLGSVEEGADLSVLMQQADAAALSYRSQGETLANEILTIARGFETVTGQMAPETLLVHDRMRAAQVPTTRPLSGPTEAATVANIRATQLRPLTRDLGNAEARLAEHERRLNDLGRPLDQELDWEDALVPQRKRRYQADADAALLRSQTGLPYQVVPVRSASGKSIVGYQVKRGMPRPATVEPPPAEATAPVEDLTSTTGEPQPAAPFRMSEETDTPGTPDNAAYARKLREGGVAEYEVISVQRGGTGTGEAFGFVRDEQWWGYDNARVADAVARWSREGGDPDSLDGPGLADIVVGTREADDAAGLTPSQPLRVRPLTGAEGAIEQAYAAGDVEAGQALNLEAEAANGEAGLGGPSAEFAQMLAQAEAAERALTPEAPAPAGLPDYEIGPRIAQGDFVLDPEAGTVTRVPPRGSPTEFPDPLDETKRVPATFALRDVDELITSDRQSFPSELQPRDRDRTMYRAEAEKRAKTFDPELAMRTESGGDGPPLVGADGVVLAGNGRTMSMRLMSDERWDHYRTALARRAEEFGMTPEQVMAMEHPVLVREVGPEMMTARYASAFNARTGGMAPAEMSNALAALVTPDDILALKVAPGTSMSEALLRADNQTFVRRLLDQLTPEQQRSYLDEGGGLGASGLTLIRGAMLGKMLPDTGLVTRLLEQTNEAVRYTGGIEEAMPQVLQAEAKAALAGDPVEIGPALSLSLRRLLDLTDRGVRAADWPSYFQTEGMGLIEGATEGNALALVLSSLKSQDEVATFLRGYAKSVDDSTAAAGGLLIAEDRTWQGFVNRGVEAVQAKRGTKEARRQSSSFFGSDDVPRMPEADGTVRAEYETPDGSLAQAVERPLVGTPEQAVAAATTGASVVHVDDIAAIDTVPDGPITFRAPTQAQFRIYDEMRTVDPAAMRQTIEGEIANPDPSAYDSLVRAVNEGYASPGQFYAMRAMSNTKHRWTADGRWDGRFSGTVSGDAVEAALADHARMQRVTELLPPDAPSVPPVDGAAVLTSSERTLRPDFEEQAGFAPDPAPDLARVDEIVAGGGRVVIPPGDAYTQRLGQTAGGLPRGARPGSTLTLNDVDQAAYLRYLTSARDQAQQEVATLQERIRGVNELAEAPAAGPPIELPPDLLELYQRYMADPAAEAIGPVAPPRTIGELFEATRSIDYGFNLSDLDEIELERLRTGLRDHMNVKLDEWGVSDRAPEAPVPPANRVVGATPTEHDQFLLDLADRLAQRTYIAESPIEGYTTIGYDFVPAPRRALTGEPLRQRLFYDDFMGDWTPELEAADQQVPGLGRELQTGRMRTFEGRLEDALDHDAAARLGTPGMSRTLRGLMDTAVGARPQADISRQAIARYIDDIVAPEASEMARIIDDPELFKAYQASQRSVRGALTYVHEQMAEIKWGPFQQYRRVGLLPPNLMEKWFREGLERQGDAGRNVIALMDQRVLAGDAHPFWTAWRKADNRIRAYFIEHPSMLGDYVEALYERREVYIGSHKARGLTVAYHVGRFLLDMRWIAQEFLEAPILVLGREGLEPFLAMGGIKRKPGLPLRFEKAEPRPMFMGEEVSGRMFDEWAWWMAQGDPGGWHRFRQRAVLSLLDRRQQRGFVEALEKLAREDPQMRSMIDASGDTPLGFLRKLDADWDLMSRRGAQIPEPRMRELLAPYIADGTVTPTEAAEFIKRGRWTGHPGLEQAIAYADDPVSRTLLRRLQVVNEQGWQDATSLVYGQVDRSNLQRLANSPFLYWPISYQIKVTKWLGGLLLDRVGGFDTGAGGATTLGLIWEANRDALINDPEFQETIRANSTLLFFLQMLLPVTPWDLGVSLSPMTRMGMQMAFGAEDPYRRNIFAIGTGYTWFELLPRLLYEQNKPGGLGTQGIPFLSTAIERAQHALPFKVGVDAPKPAAGEIEQAAQDVYQQPQRPPVRPFEQPSDRFP